MNALLRIFLAIAVALVAVVALIVVLKIVFAAAILAFAAVAATYAYHFVRALALRLGAPTTAAAGPKTMLRP